MTAAVTSHLVERVLTFIEDKIWYEVNLVTNVKDDLLDLSKKLEKIREVLEDAEKRAVKEKRVKSWLKELEATAYEMDIILDEWIYDLLKHEEEASAKPEPEQKIGYTLISSAGLFLKNLSDSHPNILD
ncbi:putative disease resistance protein RGA4 [Salvia splendens]|uniref:putative disease resistance protein RGA4 n=1 Tax=Salvia splendens TaxID=180675 RepID=UPI001C2647D3|nr:putative disease resistance protein RGA4 [Salvia splendens]